MNKEHFEETLKAIQNDHSRELSEMAQKMAEERQGQEANQTKKAEVEVESLKSEIRALLSKLEVSWLLDLRGLSSAVP